MIKRMVGVSVILGLCFASPVRAQIQAQEKPATISMDVTEAYLEDVLKILSRQSGMNFVASEAVRDKKVTLYFDNVPIQDALETILKANQLSLKPETSKNLYVVTASGAPLISTVTRVFTLKYARVLPTAGEVLPAFGMSGTLIRPTFVSEEETTATSTTGLTGITGVTGTDDKELKGGIIRIIRSLLTEHGSVVPDPRTNSLIVTEIPERMEVIAQTITRLDVQPKQIYIEAEVLEVTLDTLRRIGVEFGGSEGQIATYTGPSRTSFFPFGVGLFDAATKTRTLGTFGLLNSASANILFKLLATEKDVKFLARPRIVTLSGEVAEIRIVSEAVTGTISDSQATTGTVTTSPERTTVGTILRVTPLVNDERHVTMVIEPEVSRVIQSASFAAFLDPNRRLARTTVMVPDAGTVMIAGLISSEDTISDRKLPGLGDIPLLGAPFKRTSTERKNTEILLFITPHILDEGASPAAIAKEREQAPISTQEEKALQGYRRRLLKERAIVETIDGIVR